jgi:hypothetical protein
VGRITTEANSSLMTDFRLFFSSVPSFLISLVYISRTFDDSHDIFYFFFFGCCLLQLWFGWTHSFLFAKYIRRVFFLCLFRSMTSQPVSHSSLLVAFPKTVSIPQAQVVGRPPRGPVIPTRTHNHTQAVPEKPHRLLKSSMVGSHPCIEREKFLLKRKVEKPFGGLQGEFKFKNHTPTTTLGYFAFRRALFATFIHQSSTGSSIFYIIEILLHTC